MNRNEIYNIAWDCTIGAGNDEDESPKPEHQKYLAERLGHEPSLGEREEFLRAWARCRQEMLQP